MSDCTIPSTQGEHRPEVVVHFVFARVVGDVLDVRFGLGEPLGVGFAAMAHNDFVVIQSLRPGLVRDNLVTLSAERVKEWRKRRFVKNHKTQNTKNTQKTYSAPILKVH
jgi:hypothetical protein